MTKQSIETINGELFVVIAQYIVNLLWCRKCLPGQVYVKTVNIIKVSAQLDTNSEHFMFVHFKWSFLQISCQYFH